MSLWLLNSLDKRYRFTDALKQLKCSKRWFWLELTLVLLQKFYHKPLTFVSTNSINTVTKNYLPSCTYWRFVSFGVLLPKLFWHTVRNTIVLVIEKNFWNSRLNAENFWNFWDHLNNLFKQWKVRTIFGNLFLEVSQISKNRTIVIQIGKFFGI